MKTGLCLKVPASSSSQLVGLEAIMVPSTEGSSPFGAGKYKKE